METAPGRTPTLRELQQWMAALILDEKRLDTLAREASTLDALIALPAHASARERMHVHAGGYPARVQEALAESFPAVAHVVGDGAFARLARRFGEAVPLRSYTLNDAGAELSRFLQDDPLTAGLPFLPDLARLEWRVARAFHAPDHAPIDPAPLTTWTLDQWELAVLRFQPWVALVASEWPIREIWDCRETAIDAIDVDLRNRPDRVLVRRAGFTVVCESLAAAEARALGALLEGQPLGAVVAGLAARGDDPDAVSRWFTRWTGLRMISGSTSLPDGDASPGSGGGAGTAPPMAARKRW